MWLNAHNATTTSAINAPIVIRITLPPVETMTCTRVPDGDFLDPGALEKIGTTLSYKLTQTQRRTLRMIAIPDIIAKKNCAGGRHNISLPPQVNL